MRVRVNKKAEPIDFICDNCLENTKEVLLSGGLQLCGECISPENPVDIEDLENELIEQTNA